MATDAATDAAAGVPEVLAVDIGGTKMAVGVVDRTGDLVVHDQRPTPAHGTGDAMFAALDELVADVRARGRALGIDPTVCGAGCGGPMTRGGEAVSPLNITAWRGFPLRARLAAATGLPTFCLLYTSPSPRDS